MIPRLLLRTGLFLLASPVLLDGRPVNGHFWVFFGALSNVEYEITVTDTQTGEVLTYHNDPGKLASVADTSAF